MMESDNKITIRRGLLLYLAVTFPLEQRLVPTYSAQMGKQAGWLSPVISSVFLIVLVLALSRIYKNYDNLSFMEIVNKITGKIAGKIICVIYGLWILIELSKFVRYFAERTVSTIMTGIDVNFLIVLILAVVAIGLRPGMIVIYRMNEIILPIIIISFFIFAILIASDIKIPYLTPISYLDIIPIIKASIGTTGIWAYLPVIFFLSNGFCNSKKLRSEGIKIILFLTVITLILNIITIGVFDYSVVERLPSPYSTAIKNISVIKSFQKADPIVIALWVIEDFLLFSMFSYAFLNILKYLLGLTDMRFLIGPVLIFVYFFSLFIAENRFELESFSTIIAIPANIVLFVLLPILLLFIGKLRKKI